MASNTRIWLAGDERCLETLRAIGGIVMVILGLSAIAAAVHDLIAI